MATVMTSGRLSIANRKTIKVAYSAAFTTDPSMAAIKAQELIAISAEFHTTGTVERSAGGARNDPEPPILSPRNHKAVIYLMLAGGCDSFNMTVPHRCSTNLVDQYEEERGELKLTSAERHNVIEALGHHNCSEFTLHPELPYWAQLYNHSDVAFF